MRAAFLLLLVLGVACGPAPAQQPVDAGARPDDAFADRVESFDPGEYAGFGADKLPGVALGPPVGCGAACGSLDVVSLGDNGVIVLAFTDEVLVDGAGADLVVFENAFSGFVETAFVAVSEDGQRWHEWPCEPENRDGGYPHCAGAHAVLSNPDNGIPATDPARAGGDAFDLSELGVTRARFVRIRDSGKNTYAGTSGGFDLDAVAVVHGSPVP